jgi:transposase InsO family protein
VGQQQEAGSSSLSLELCHLCLCLLQPVRHAHVAVHRRCDGQVFVGLLVLAGTPVELAEAVVAAGDEGAHAARFGETTLKAPHAVQWLSDNGPQYTATATVLYAHELGLVRMTTPAYSPESNGLAEAFVVTFKRDYVAGAELRDAETVLAQLGDWFEDYNTLAPHSALGMRSPADYRAGVTLSSSR